LEWATSSPPPPYNFAVMPEVEGLDAFWDMKQRGVVRAAPAYDAVQRTTVAVAPGNVPIEQTDITVRPAYEAIEMPRNSPIGFIIAFFAVMIGFAGIWHIWWMAIVGFLAAVVAAAVFGWSENREVEVSPIEIARMEQARLVGGGAA